jgi:hypothetical protein
MCAALVQQVPRFFQCRGTKQGQVVQIFVADLDDVGVLQGVQHMCAVALGVRQDGGAQVGVNHHFFATVALRCQPG